jgi:FixJ family two-component response regulator
LNKDVIMSKSKEKIIFFVDDDPKARKLASKALSQLSKCNVVCFDDAKSCMAELKKNECDIIVTAVKMPKTDGIKLTKKIKELIHYMPVIAITECGDVSMVVKAFKSGVFDIIEKPLSVDKLLPVVKEVIKILPPDDTPELSVLTKTEIKILKEIGTGKSNKQIAVDIDRSVRTVENHRFRVMQKLGVKNAVELTKTAINMGLAAIK